MGISLRFREDCGPRSSKRPDAGPKGRFALELCHVVRLEPLGALADREFHGLAFGERLESFRFDSGMMHKHIITRRPLDKSITLRVVEPFYLSLFFVHTFCHRSLFCVQINLFGSRSTPQKQERPQNRRFCGLKVQWYSVTKTDQALLVYHPDTNHAGNDLAHPSVSCPTSGGRTWHHHGFVLARGESKLLIHHGITGDYLKASA